MIAKVSNGSVFKGLIVYLNKDDAKLLAVNGLRGEVQSMIKDYKDHCEVMGRMVRGNPKFVFHASLSFSPRDNLSDLQMQKAGELYIEKMGFKDCQYSIWQHNDKSHKHIHLAINRLNFSGHLVSNSYSAIRSKYICREIEVEMNLERFNDVYRNKEIQKSLTQEFNEIKSCYIPETQKEVDFTPILYVSQSKHRGEEEDMILRKKKKQKNLKNILRR